MRSVALCRIAHPLPRLPVPLLASNPTKGSCAFPPCHGLFGALLYPQAPPSTSGLLVIGFSVRTTSQYIILIAGLDSFAYRRADLLPMLDVYEVDHPASQAWKRKRVEELGIKIPARLHYVPIDFDRETLTEGLAAGGVDHKAAAFFSWLG